MKTIIFIFLLVLYGVFNYGYYIYLEDAEPERIFFKKRFLSPQVRFDNIFANEADDVILEQLTFEQRNKVIVYCKYRLGIITELTNDADLERCKYGFGPKHFRSEHLREAQK